MQDAAPAGIGAMAAVLGADDAMVEQACVDASGSEIVVPVFQKEPAGDRPVCYCFGIGERPREGADIDADRIDADSH